MKKAYSKNPFIKSSVFLFIALTLVLSACSPAEQSTHTEVVAAEDAAFAALSFTDAVGREVVISEVPASVVSLAPSITETLYAIGAGDLVVGRTEYCNYPEEVLDVPVIGGFSSSEISTESIVDLDPDLVIGGSIYQEEITDVLTEAGLNGFIQESGSVDAIMEFMLLLGDITDRSESAQMAVADMQARIDTVTSVVASIPEDERVTVFYEVWHDPYMTTTDQTFIGELINLAGGVNIFADLDEDYPTISAEEIIDADPQVILGPSSHGDQLTAEMIAAREGWSGLSAVKNNRVYVIDGDILSRDGPRVVDALEDIAVALYPDYFEE